MPMNKKTYNKIVSLYKEGMDRKTAVRLFIKLAKNPDDASEAICEFYNSLYLAQGDLKDDPTSQ